MNLRSSRFKVNHKQEKTQLLANLKHTIENEERMRNIRVSHIKMSTEEEHDVLKHYKKMKGFLSFLSKSSYVMGIDEIDTVYKEETFWKSLKSLIDRRPGDLVLLISVTPEVLT